MSNDKVGATTHGGEWFVIEPETPGQQWFLGRGGTPERPVHVHPLGFNSGIEARRARTRLQAREPRLFRGDNDSIPDGQ